MRITKLGHACLLVEEQETLLLIDPGAFSDGLEDVRGLDAILITHDHFDHMAPESVAHLLQNNPDVVVYAEPDAAKLLKEHDIEAIVATDGDEFDIKGVRIQAFGTKHNPVHHDLPDMGNVGFMVAGRLFYPGDALTVPPVPVEILAQPTDGPWLKLEETLDYLKVVKPKVTIPVHEKTLAMPAMNYGPMEQFAKNQGIEYRNIDNGKPADF